MARPAKSVDAQISHLTKGERKRREENEAWLRGASDQAHIPIAQLTENQLRIREWIMEEIGDIASNKDRFTIDLTAFTIDVLQRLNAMSIENPDIILDSKFIKAENMYFKECMKLEEEIGLTQKIRAKIANAMPEEKKPDPLMELLMDDDDPPAKWW